MSTNQDILDALTARLLGHDPDRWSVHESQRPAPGRRWYCIRTDSDMRLFETKEQAEHFRATGVQL